MMAADAQGKSEEALRGSPLPGTRGAASQAGAGVRLKTIALPTEHGGWGLSLEPLLLGLLVAPSLPGLFLACATMGAFLARHPFKIVAGDLRRGRRFARTPVAERFVLIYGSLAALAFFAALALAPDRRFLFPLLLAAPLAVVQLVYDALGRSRALVPELSGATGLAAVAAAIALADRWPAAPAYALWVVLAARVFTAILYVRVRLKRLHGERSDAAPVLLAHVFAVALVAALAWLKLLPALAVVASVVLLARAVHGLSGRDEKVTAKRVGIREMGYGLLTVVAVAVGRLAGL